ncbi:hypothetical protein ONZ45_g5333 [Pleurotus djamor]|nr:hypothetical protein ONZ45_g5333 [Pleurotus djamor]
MAQTSSFLPTQQIPPAKQPASAHPPLHKVVSTTTTVDVPKRRCPRGGRKPPPGHIPRPRNSFMIFRSAFLDERPIDKTVEHDHRIISRIIASLWHKMDPEERKIWNKRAEEEKDEHTRKYPDYRFTPKPRSPANAPIKRNVKRNNKAELERCDRLADLIKAGKKGDELAQAAKALAVAPVSDSSSRKKRNNKSALFGHSIESSPSTFADLPPVESSGFPQYFPTSDATATSSASHFSSPHAPMSPSSVYPYPPTVPSNAPSSSNPDNTLYNFAAHEKFYTSNSYVSPSTSTTSLQHQYLRTPPVTAPTPALSLPTLPTQYNQYHQQSQSEPGVYYLDNNMKNHAEVGGSFNVSAGVLTHFGVDGSAPLTNSPPRFTNPFRGSEAAQGHRSARCKVVGGLSTPLSPLSGLDLCDELSPYQPYDEAQLREEEQEVEMELRYPVPTPRHVPTPIAAMEESPVQLHCDPSVYFPQHYYDIRTYPTTVSSPYSSSSTGSPSSYSSSLYSSPCAPTLASLPSATQKTSPYAFMQVPLGRFSYGTFLGDQHWTLADWIREYPQLHREDWWGFQEWKMMHPDLMISLAHWH